MTEMVLTSENVEELSECRIVPYQLPHNPDITVNIKQLPVSDLKRLGKQLGKPGPTADLAEIEFISLGVVNPNGTPIYTPDKAKLLKTGNAPLFMSLMILVNRANTPPKSEDDELDSLRKN